MLERVDQALGNHRQIPFLRKGAKLRLILLGLAGLLILALAGGGTWFLTHRAGLITEFSIPTAKSIPFGITVGPDGNLWFTESNANRIGRISPAGTITE